MSLKTISARNLKGKTFSHELAPFSVFVGPNGIGKSAVKEAIMLATNRFVPTLGNKDNLTYQLASDDDMIVVAAVEENGIIRSGSQRWSNQTPRYSGAPIVNNPPELADVGVFFNMTGTERAAHVTALVDLAKLGFTGATIINTLNLIETKSEQAATIHSELMQEVGLSIHENAGKPINEWAQKLVDDIATQFSQADKLLKGLQLVQSAKVQTQAGPLFAESVPADIEQRLADARAKLDEAKQARNKNDTMIETAERTLANIETTKTLPKVEIPIGDPAQIEKEIAKLGQERVGIKLDENAYVAQCKAESAWNQAKLEAESFDSEFHKTSDALSEFKEDCVCSECKRVYPPDMVRAAKKRLSEAKKEAKANLAKATALEEKARKAFEEATAANKGNRQREEKRQSLFEKIGALQIQKNKILSAIAKAATDASNLGDETELRKQLSECEANAETHKSQITEAEAKVNELAELDKQRIRKMQDAKREQEATEKRWEAQARFDILSDAKKRLQGELKRFSGIVWQTLTEKARRFTDGIFDESLNLDFHEGQLGSWNGERFVSSNTFSGSQRFLAHLGLQVALCEKAPLKIIMCDEAGVLDDVRAERFCKRVHELLDSGVIDQCVVFDWSTRWAAIHKRLGVGDSHFKITEVA